MSRLGAGCSSAPQRVQRPDRERQGEREAAENDGFDGPRFEPPENRFAVADGERRFDAEPDRPRERESDKEEASIHLERSRGDDKRRERKRRRDEIEDGQRNRAAVPNTIPDG